MKQFLIVGMVIFLSIGCANMRKSVTLGVTTGAASGAMTGAYLGKRNRSRAALQGAIVTGVIGGLVGYLIHKALETRDKEVRRQIFFSLDKPDMNSPKNSLPKGPGLTMPKVEAQWVETQIRGKKLVEGHRVWIITEDPQWVSDPKNEAKSKSKTNKKRIKRSYKYE